MHGPMNIKKHPPSSSVEVKNKWSYTSIPLYVFIAYTLINLRFKDDILFASICVQHEVN